MSEMPQALYLTLEVKKLQEKTEVKDVKVDEAKGGGFLHGNREMTGGFGGEMTAALYLYLWGLGRCVSGRTTASTPCWR